MLKPTKKIQIGLLAIALGFGSTAFSLGGAAFDSANAFAQTPTAVDSTLAANGANYPALVRSQELLLKARRSLMSRDVASAERFAKDAQATNAAYSAASDRPDYVFPLIEQYKRLESAAKTQGLTESVKRDLAKNYLEQAEGLRRCQDLDAAESLVSEARSLNVVFDVATIERKMDLASVEQRVSDDRLAARAIAPVAGQPLVGLSEATKRQVASIQANLKEARALAANGQAERAEAAVRELQALGVPENAFAGGDSPAKFLRDVATERSQAIRQVQATVPGVAGDSAGVLYIQEADEALAKGDNETALANYRDALRYAAELDRDAVRHINDSIANLTNPIAAAPEPTAAATGIDLTQSPEAIQNEIAAFVAKQNQARETEPKEALADLKQLRSEIEASALDASMKAFFVHNIDVAIADTNDFIAANGSRIALEQQNNDVDARVREKRQRELDMQNRLAEDVDKFEALMEEGRYEEAGVLAKKCRDYSDNDPVSVAMVQKAAYGGQVAFNEQLQETKNERNLAAWNDVENSAYSLVDDANPLVFDQNIWSKAKNRKAVGAEDTRSEADREILRKLESQVTLPFDQPTPLDVVLDFVRKSVDMNIMVDEAALGELGVTSDMTVATNFTNIKLKNYLKHVLSPYNLTYIVEDEVLTITGKNKHSGKTVVKYYPVADLVIGVPNFGSVVSPMSMEAAYGRAYQAVANRGLNGSSAGTIQGLASGSAFGANDNSSLLSPNIAAQINSGSANVPVASGAAGGGMSDPGELIDLITAVVDPDSWETLGTDPQFFALNNTLAIRQTEENHEEIRGLLEKLRALNDLQVAVEVRFITISDEYFEKIGVNMNLSFHGSSSEAIYDQDGYTTPANKGVYGIVDANSTGGSQTFTDNLNVSFSQNSYGVATPQFGNYDPSVGAQMGFAILSDIESYFFVSAAESDRRTNVLQAPKVTMFNGQMASINDSMQIPYVYSVIPVVGEFAVAQQPVVTVVNEGQFMTVQATASPDRQYVRMTVVPFFSKVTDKNRTFKFEGTDSVSTNNTSSSKGSGVLDSITDERESNSGAEIVSAGTTIQQPIVSSFSVYTTVNVPDGGTVLLGGIKRLSEGRNEAGVPILSKIPYLKRLFSNSAIGRETTSLLMTVTPRIIIQEEEEEFATGGNASK